MNETDVRLSPCRLPGNGCYRYLNPNPLARVVLHSLDEFLAVIPVAHEIPRDLLDLASFELPRATTRLRGSVLIATISTRLIGDRRAKNRAGDRERFPAAASAELIANKATNQAANNGRNAAGIRTAGIRVITVAMLIARV
jgi:hypothetical protein